MTTQVSKPSPRTQKNSRPRIKDITPKLSPKKKVFASKIQAISKKKLSLEKFSQAFWRSPRRNKIGHDLGPFSTSQKIVLSSSRGQGIFEDLQASRLRPTTSNCVIEAKYVLKDSTSANKGRRSGSLFLFFDFYESKF